MAKFMWRNGTEAEVFVDSFEVNEGNLYIKWFGDIGFGEYSIFSDENGNFEIDSEYMDELGDFSFLDCLIQDIKERTKKVI